jgi:hypothetical protein
LLIKQVIPKISIPLKKQSIETQNYSRFPRAKPLALLLFVLLCLQSTLLRVLANTYGITDFRFLFFLLAGKILKFPMELVLVTDPFFYLLGRLPETLSVSGLKKGKPVTQEQNRPSKEPYPKR